MRKIVKEWLRRGEDDEAYARSLLRDRDVAPWGIGFHAQQMAEKFLKAYLVSVKADFPKVHQLDRLLKLCAEVDQAFANKDLVKNARSLSEHYYAERYPGTMQEVTWSEAEQALLQAEEIKEFVLKKIKE